MFGFGASWLALVAFAKAYAMDHQRHVRLFRNGRSQAVRIPREFELPGNEALMRKEGHRIIIESALVRPLGEVLAGLETLEEDFGPIDDPAPEPVKF